MASGCIFGTCPVCDDLVWEDEWDIVDDIMLHERCRTKHVQDKYGVSHAQFLRLTQAGCLQASIAALKQRLEVDMQFYSEQLAALEREVHEITDERT